ncbi:hypothetical protein GALMADRAFT_283459 [Galerina marginata CBS 339.88]|uniref:Uncharacterized protein n=1 Tax=Galerina marginata (strain CBS 339.88) TaxID=685588 RepID=A0A067SCM7_GALM3|nr:hypothetical protein GALMADRAFT_283459 [Galerina marginata CBS 339.88]
MPAAIDGPHISLYRLFTKRPMTSKTRVDGALHSFIRLFDEREKTKTKVGQELDCRLDHAGAHPARQTICQSAVILHSLAEAGRQGWLGLVLFFNGAIFLSMFLHWHAIVHRTAGLVAQRAFGPSIIQSVLFPCSALRESSKMELWKAFTAQQREFLHVAHGDTLGTLPFLRGFTVSAVFFERLRIVHRRVQPEEDFTILPWLRLLARSALTHTLFFSTTDRDGSLGAQTAPMVLVILQFGKRTGLGLVVDGATTCNEASLAETEEPTCTMEALPFPCQSPFCISVWKGRDNT